MIELTLKIRDKHGNDTGKTITKSFDTGYSAGGWYNNLPGRNLDREVDNAYHRDNPRPKNKKKR